MKRIIKFRKYDKVNNVWKISDLHNIGYLGDYHWEDDSVGQYTGLKDKNGVEIYEGDIFGILGGDKDRPGEYEVHGQVKFDEDFAMFVIELTNGGWMQLFDYMNNKTRAREVIGNIYQTELLK